MTGKAQATRPADTKPPTPAHAAPGNASSARPRADVTELQRNVAQTWLRRGMPVVPCSRTDKGAMVPGFGARATPEQLAPFSDPETVRSWWSGKFARAHVGIMTRTLVVVDLDMPKADAAPLEGRWSGCQDGSDILELLRQEAGGEWPETYTVLTPSDGLHLYFLQPEGQPIGCATGEGPTAPHLGPLVDVRGVGGYVIAAGSYSSVQGRAYTRISNPSVRPQPLPGWLLELLRPSAPPAAPPRPPTPVRTLAPRGGTRAERYATASLNGAAEDLVGLGEGDGRNNRLFAAARRLGELSSTAPAVLTETAVREQLLAAALRCGLPGGERVALRTIRSGWERGLEGLGGAA